MTERRVPRNNREGLLEITKRVVPREDMQIAVLLRRPSFQS